MPQQPPSDLNLEVVAELREMKGSLKDGLNDLQSVVGDLSQVMRQFSSEMGSMEHRIATKLTHGLDKSELRL